MHYLLLKLNVQAVKIYQTVPLPQRLSQRPDEVLKRLTSFSLCQITLQII